MTIIDAKGHFDPDKIKPFLEAVKDNKISVVVNGQATLTTTATNFIDDLIIGNTLEQFGKDNGKLMIVCTDLTSCTITLLLSDFYFYHGRKARMTKLKNAVYGISKDETEKKPKVSKRLMQLQLEEAAMKQQRIVAIMIGTDVTSIEAYKGDGYGCADWLNKQFVLKHEQLPMLKVCLNFSKESTTADFQTVKVLIEIGAIVLC